MLTTCGTYILHIDTVREEDRSNGKMWSCGLDGRSKLSGAGQSLEGGGVAAREPSKREELPRSKGEQGGSDDDAAACEKRMKSVSKNDLKEMIVE
jgi:hypothetical protein